MYENYWKRPKNIPECLEILQVVWKYSGRSKNVAKSLKICINVVGA